MWGNVTPFAIKSAKQFAVKEPPEVAGPEYAQEVETVYQLGGQESHHRLPDQTQAAYFWNEAEGTSTLAGHWNIIAQTIAQRQRTNMVQNARLFALLNMALADAGIACWHCKYEYRRLRPLTAIHYADRDGNTRTRPDMGWEPLLEAPLSPSYVSAHSTLSGAAEAVLAGYFGSNVPLNIPTETKDVAARSFSNVRAAAEEAGQSRIYGGVQFPLANQQGLALGREIGKYVVQNELLPKRTVWRK